MKKYRTAFENVYTIFFSTTNEVMKKSVEETETVPHGHM